MGLIDDVPAILELAWADFKLKYQGSVFGLLWTLLKPFLLLITLYVVFTYFLSVGIDNFHLYILLGLVIWNFFADTVTDAMSSVMGKSDILKSIRFKPSLLVLSTCLHSFVTYLINVVVFLVIYLFSGFVIDAYLLGFLLLSVLLFFFVYASALIVSYFYMQLDDIDHIWDVLSQMLFWLTPLVYPIENVPQLFERFYMLNPVTRFVVHGRSLMLYDRVPPTKQLLITVFITLFLTGVTMYVFRHQSRRFIERL